MRIEQYFLMTDYALWEVILNGDSPLPTRTVDGVKTAVPPTTAEQKLARKNELKARVSDGSNKERFGGNKESKKTQKTLLKQQYENFNESSSEGLDQTYDRLQKLISQLEILAFVSSNITGSTNEAVKTAHGVSTTNSKDNASTLPNVDSLSDAVIYSFFASQGDGLKVADGNADNESKEISQEDMKESRAPKNQDSRNRETRRRIVPIKETTLNALVSQYDRFGYDWSD
ncbi:hypothetical protein Tco_0974021 [Tanacetum coccineum]|uniref:Uncharacterized protein n=1 Tax=Tanacetum coccineum TaxID=301880 RepID=A0ABQ5EAE9_9ASTR